MCFRKVELLFKRLRPFAIELVFPTVKATMAAPTPEGYINCS